MNKKLIPFALILSALFLAGCGATDALPSDGSEAGSVEPTVVMTEEAPALEEPTEAVMDAPAMDSAAPDTASVCYHPFFPVSEGANWTFQLSTGESYTMTISNLTSESFTQTQDFTDSDLVLSVDWFCSEDGLLQGDFAQVDFLNGSGGEDGVEMNFDTLTWEGETLPSEDMLEVGHEWTATYQLKGDVDMEGVVTTADATVTIGYVIAAIEEVTVPAGTFPEAYRVDSTGAIDMTMEFNGTVLPLTGINFGSSSWYVKDVGLVKSADSFESGSSGMELIDSNLLH